MKKINDAVLRSVGVVSGVKLDEGNACPGVEAGERFIDDINMELGGCVVMDFPDREYWSNARDTLTFALTYVPDPKRSAFGWFLAGVSFMEAVRDLCPDEFNQIVLPGGVRAFRLWWD